MSWLFILHCVIYDEFHLCFSMFSFFTFERFEYVHPFMMSHGALCHIAILPPLPYKVMPCTGQLGVPILKASGWFQNTPFGLGDKSPKITDQPPAGGSVSQLSQLTKPSPWLTLSTKDITPSSLFKSCVCIISVTQQNKICAFMMKNKCGLS